MSARFAHAALARVGQSIALAVDVLAPGCLRRCCCDPGVHHRRSVGAGCRARGDAARRRAGPHEKQPATTERRLEEATAALDRQRELLSSAEARLAETSASLAETTAEYSEAHRDREQLLAQAGAHRASRWPRGFPGSRTRSRARSQQSSR